jgi:hypothetical protein
MIVLPSEWGTLRMAYTKSQILDCCCKKVALTPSSGYTKTNLAASATALAKQPWVAGLRFSTRAEPSSQSIIIS